MRQWRNHAVVVARGREHRRRIIAIRFVKLIVVILGLAEVVDDVTEQEGELRNFCQSSLGKIGNHFVRDLILRLRPPGTSTIAGRMKHDLAAGLNPVDGGGVAAEDFGQG